MSGNPRANRMVRQTALALASIVGVACGDDADSGGSTDAGARDAAVAGHNAGGAGGAHAAGKGGSGGRGGTTADNTSQEVTIRFKAAVADRDFSCLDRYENVGATHATVVPADFRFYVQDVKLIDANDKEVPVTLDTRAPWQTKDVALVDFEDLQGHCHGTAETNTTITGRVPRGEYKGIVFSNGVPESLNHLDQSKQPAPLDVTDLYWTWLSGYRFVVAEVTQDAAESGAAPAGEEDGGAALPGLGLMHVGSTACSKDKGCTKPNRNLIRLPEFDVDNDVIVADLGAIFSNTDVTKEQQCHAADEVCGPMFEQIGVSFENGGSLDEQKVYRVEQGDK